MNTGEQVPNQPTEPKDATDHVVMLIHGIRTEADWQEMVVSKLEAPGIRVFPIKYGYFDAFRFLIPGLRNQPVAKVLKEIRVIRDRFPTANLSVIAHSFGTYVVSRILQENFEIRLHRTLFCGAVVTTNYPWEKVLRQITNDQVVNECGKSDVWPVIAQSVTWGYGASGTHGFGGVVVKDRYHSGGHSQYFTPEYVETYWVPFIQKGLIVQSEWEASRPNTPWWLSILGWLPLRYVALGLIISLVILLGWKPIAELINPARPNPQKVVVEKPAELVDVSFEDHLNENIAPRADFKISNPSQNPVLLKSLRVDVHKTWTFQKLPESMQAFLPPDHTYIMKLSPADAPYQRNLKVSQAIPPKGLDRFLVQFQEEQERHELFDANTVYYATLTLIADADDKIIGKSDVIFMISYQGNPIPSLNELQPLIAMEKQLGRPVSMDGIRKAIAANRAFIEEIEGIKAKRSPSLEKIIEQLNN